MGVTEDSRRRFVTRMSIEDRLGALEIPVYVYAEFHAGQRADEPSA